MRILVTTPSGQIGGRVADRLLAARERHPDLEVVLFARDPSRVAAALRAGAHAVHTGDLADPAALTEAARGADAAFYLIPPNFGAEDWLAWQRRVIDAQVAAAAAAGVRRVVFLSSAGADRDDLLAISVLGEAERRLAAVVPDVATIRAGYFMENLLASLPTIESDGAIYSPVPPDARTGFVATDDLGDAAAALLLDPDWSGFVVRPVQGPEDLSFAEAAATLGEVLGREVRHVQIPVQAVADAFRGMGASESVAAVYPEMIHRLATLGFPREPRTPATASPTSLRAWAARALAPIGARAGD